MYGPEFEKQLDALESRYPVDRKRAALLGALHAVQDRVGHVPDEAVHWLAARYGTSAADVRGVVSFYTMFFTKPVGQRTIWLCRTFPCELMGAREVMAELERVLGCRVGETDPAGEFQLRWMECLAACDGAPCALVGDDMALGLTPRSVRAVLDHLRANAGDVRVERDASGAPRVVAAAPAGGR